MATVSHKNVALVKVGTHAASTGVTKITAEDLASMAEAYADTVVDRPVIKLGHDDNNVFNAALGDGEPAYGWVGNVGVGDGSAERPDRDTLYGDYVGMPAKLAEVAPTAYRRRSVEIAWGVKTAASKAYRAVLTGVALLGVARPAVKGLADVVALYSGVDEAEAVDVIEFTDQISAEAASFLAAARVEVTNVALSAGMPATALNAALDRLDRLAGVQGDDTVSVPHNSATPPEGDGASTSTDQEGTRMTIKKADVEKALEAAGDEDVTARLNELLKGTDTGTAPAAGAVSTTAAAAGAVTEPVKAPEGVTVPAGTLLVTEAMWAEVQSKLSAAESTTATVDAQRRDGIVETAFSEGRITGEERKTWREKLDENEALTTSLLSSLTPRFATTTIPAPGHVLTVDGESQLSGEDKTAWDSFAAEMTA